MLGALAHCLQRCTNCRTAEVCIFFQMTQNGVCIRSVFEQKIGPYKVCILVNMGPLERLAALRMVELSRYLFWWLIRYIHNYDKRGVF